MYRTDVHHTQHVNQRWQQLTMCCVRSAKPKSTHMGCVGKLLAPCTTAAIWLAAILSCMISPVHPLVAAAAAVAAATAA